MGLLSSISSLKCQNACRAYQLIVTPRPGFSDGCVTALFSCRPNAVVRSFAYTWMSHVTVCWVIVTRGGAKKRRVVAVGPVSCVVSASDSVWVLPRFSASENQSPYVCNGGRDHQFSSEWRHNQNGVIMRTGAASAVGARRHNENDVTMTIAGLWRYGD